MIDRIQTIFPHQFSTTAFSGAVWILTLSQGWERQQSSLGVKCCVWARRWTVSNRCYSYLSHDIKMPAMGRKTRSSVMGKLTHLWRGSSIGTLTDYLNSQFLLDLKASTWCSCLCLLSIMLIQSSWTDVLSAWFDGCLLLYEGHLFVSWLLSSEIITQKP